VANSAILSEVSPIPRDTRVLQGGVATGSGSGDGTVQKAKQW